MITAEQKPLEEIIEFIRPFQRILLVGCNECVTVCAAGGRKEVGHPVLAAANGLPEAGQEPANPRTDPGTPVRSGIHGGADPSEWTASRRCCPWPAAAGSRKISRRFKDKPVFPAVNTKFMGASERQGVWAERCQGCGDCLLGVTGGICPIARCSKRLMNGPCGGSTRGKCEISPEVDCAWQLIWDRLKALGLEDRYEDLHSGQGLANSRRRRPPQDYTERIWQNENRKHTRKSIGLGQSGGYLRMRAPAGSRSGEDQGKGEPCSGEWSTRSM